MLKGIKELYDIDMEIPMLFDSGFNDKTVKLFPNSHYANDHKPTEVSLGFASGIRDAIEFVRHCENSHLIFCNAGIFDNSPGVIEYTIRTISKCNFEKSIYFQEMFMSDIEGKSTIQLSSEYGSGLVSIEKGFLPEGISFEDAFNKELNLSLAHYFEVAYTWVSESEDRPFKASGTFLIDGILHAIRNEEHETFQFKGQLKELQNEVAKKKALLEIIDSNISKFLIDGKDKTQLLERAAGERGLELTEFAIGTNDIDIKHIDFSHNAQINEGVMGVHFGIGDGSTGFHIDLISTKTNWQIK